MTVESRVLAERWPDNPSAGGPISSAQVATSTERGWPEWASIRSQLRPRSICSLWWAPRINHENCILAAPNSQVLGVWAAASIRPVAELE